MPQPARRPNSRLKSRSIGLGWENRVLSIAQMINPTAPNVHRAMAIHESAARPATTATSIRGIEGVIEKRALLVEWVGLSERTDRRTNIVLTWKICFVR